MSQFWRLIGGVRRYGVYTSWGVVFHVLTALLTIVSIPLVIPFFQLLFGASATRVQRPLSFWDLEGQLAWTFQELIDSTGSQRALLMICGLVIMVFALKNLSRFMISYFMVPVRNAVLRDLRSDIWQRYEIMTLTQRNEEKQGYLLSLITNDLSEVDHGILKVFEMLFKTPLVVLGSLLMMFWLSPKLTLIAFGLILFTLLIVGVVSHVLKRQSAQAQGSLSTMSTLVDEYLGSFRAIKSFNAGAYFRDLFDTENQAYYEVTKKMLRRRDLASPLSEFLGVVTVVVLLYAGSQIVLAQEMMASTFFAFIFAFYNIIDPAKSFAREYANVQRGLAALDRIEEFVGVEQSVPSARSDLQIESFDHQLRFDSISFGYDRKHPVLRSLSLNVSTGEKVGIVGYSGQGKTSLLDLLLGFYPLSDGTITIDEHDITTLDIDQYRELFGLVGQSPSLFFGTVRDNVLLGATEDVTHLTQVMKTVNLSTDILDQKVGDRGTRISGGEAQRITIARALYRRPQILLLDEPTSQLDSKNEAEVVQSLLGSMASRTVLMITHNVKLLSTADRIVVLHEGQIVDEGTYYELMISSEIFKSLIG